MTTHWNQGLIAGIGGFSFITKAHTKSETHSLSLVFLPWSRKLTTHLLVVLRFRMSGAISPTLYMPSSHIKGKLYILWKPSENVAGFLYTYIYIYIIQLYMVIPFIAELNKNAALTQNLPHLSSTELYPPGKSILLPSSGGKCIHKTLFIWQLATPLPSNCSTQWQAEKCPPFFLFSSHISVNITFLLTIFKESAKHVSLRLADTCPI